MQPTWDLVAVLLAVIALLLIALVVHLGRDRRRARSRMRQALAGEERAARLLEDNGYRIEWSQERAYWWIAVDGETVEVELRADYVVACGDERFVAEIKTGDLAPDPTHPATRRQLLEYDLAFGLDGVLLVDVARGNIRRVAFPRAAPA